MLTKEDNDLLCRVEGSAAMGQMMRRHWLPVCMSEEVAERDGAPVRARLLGEDLVVFRDTQGRLGVLEERCAHRGASLAFGRNEECGLRCLYHGWKINVNGEVVEAPNHAGDQKQFCSHVRVNRYGVVERGGIVWVWLGKGDKAPKFPELPFVDLMHSARVWFTKNADLSGSWDTEQAGRLAYRVDGYPTHAPQTLAGIKDPQITATIWADASAWPDGTYTADGSYATPESVETIRVTVTLEDDIVTAVQVTGDPQKRESVQYQGQFIGGIADVVVGQDIDEIRVSRVAGSSLTSRGFNQAIEAIKSEAAH